MLKYDKRFFEFDKCVFSQHQNLATLHFVGIDNFEPEIFKHERSVTRQVLDFVGEKIGIEFEYAVVQKPVITDKNFKDVIDQLNAFRASLPSAVHVDKTAAVGNIEYLLGMVVKSRPVRIKYLRITPEIQTTAGQIAFLTKREYKRRDHESGEEKRKEYFTFLLDDGADRVQCVFFPSQKTQGKFEQLVDRDVVTLVGVHDKRGDKVDFRVLGVSHCEYKPK